MKRERILLCKPKMCGRELDYIREALKEDWAVPLGPDVNGFEKELEDFVNSTEPVSFAGQNDGAVSHDNESVAPALDKKVVALSAGTAAVHLALIACGVGLGDEVMVQSFTFCASSHPVTYLGATPVFVDSEPQTWNIDPQLLDEAIADRIAKTGR
ncbi:MAG: DegT/DnrJ/EryC1/StrS family aminotransferase, partial [Muribaculaceae bacterium]|nr:DegT/DnrJ/EryC1/StrS family aminotransferase [Muribaculaceae bacterium]